MVLLLLLLLAGLVLALVAALLVSGIQIGEKIPEFEEIKNSTIKHNISAKLDFYINIVEPMQFKISLENCDFLYLTDNTTVLRCKNIYYFEKNNISITCTKSFGEWLCEKEENKQTEYFKAGNELLKNITKYTVLKKEIKEINGRKAYCYYLNFTLPEYEDITDISGRIYVCYDKETKIDLLMNATIEGYSNFLKVKMNMLYKFKNIKVNPPYEEYKNLLKIPGKIKEYINLNVNVSKDFVEITSEDPIKGNIEKVVFSDLQEYEIKSCK